MDILYKLLIDVLLTLFYDLSSVTANTELRTSNITCTNHNPKVVANLTCSISNESVATISMRASFKDPIRDIHIRYRLASYLWGEEEDLYKGDFSLCTKYDTGLVMRDISAHGKLPTSCPVPANTEYYVDHYYMDTSIVPPFIPEQTGYLYVQVMTGKKVLFDIKANGYATKEK